MNSSSLRSMVRPPPAARASRIATASGSAPARSSSPLRTSTTPSPLGRLVTWKTGTRIAAATLVAAGRDALHQQQRDVVARRLGADELLDEMGAQRLQARHAV